MTNGRIPAVISGRLASTETSTAMPSTAVVTPSLASMNRGLPDQKLTRPAALTDQHEQGQTVDPAAAEQGGAGADERQGAADHQRGEQVGAGRAGRVVRADRDGDVEEEVADSGAGRRGRLSRGVAERAGAGAVS